MSVNGYVYFVIPPELKGTNRVKIGMSNLDNDTRIKSYGKDTDIVIKYNCHNPKCIENKIIKAFKDNFKLIKGNEYFEGDIEEMKKIFLRILLGVNESKCNIDKYINIEEHNENNVKHITSYEKWNIHNFEIKIIKKSTGEGFYRCGKNQLWRKLYNSTKVEKNCETLLSLVNHFDKGYNDNKSIYNDIIDKCYSNIYLKIIELDYNKFIIRNFNEDRFIFNSLNLECKPLDEEIDSDTILLEDYENEDAPGLSKYILEDFRNINNEIVDEMLSYLISEKMKFNYKRFMHKLIIYSTNEENVFYDDNKWCLFTSWTSSLLRNLGKTSDILRSTEYYDNKKEFVKKYKKYKPRLLIITPRRIFHDITPNISDFRKFNFKNIIICDPNNDIYNTKTFMNYLNINENKIIDVIIDQTERAYDNQDQEYRRAIKITKPLNMYFIFESTNLLQINLLRWILN